MALPDDFLGAFFNDAFLGLDHETTAWFERDRHAPMLRFAVRL